MSAPPFSIRSVPGAPIIVSVPHSGRHYAPWQTQLRFAPNRLRALEDPWVDRLVEGMSGFTVAVAHVPRAIIDLNRDESDLDPLLFGAGVSARPTARARSGLGIIPSRLAPLGAIWNGKLSQGDLDERLNAIYRPWHSAIGQALQTARRACGIAMLIDLHSMPARSSDADIVLGDRFGRSASSKLADLAEQLLSGEGLTVARNAPYAGGAMISRHGHPDHGIHALQFELNRRLYLSADEYMPSTDLPKIASMLTRVLGRLNDALSPPQSLAAE